MIVSLKPYERCRRNANEDSLLHLLLVLRVVLLKGVEEPPRFGIEP